MAILKIWLTDVYGSFAMDKKDVSIEWIVLSDTLHDFPVAIAQQGTVPSGGSMIKPNGDAAGWLAPGSPYILGNDCWKTCYAGPLDVNGRKIIGGDGDIDIGAGIVITRKVNDAPVIRWTIKQSYSTSYQQRSKDGNPSVNDRVTIRYSVEWEEIPFVHDMIDPSNLVLNSAGQIFNPPAVRRRKIPVYSITRRELWNPMAKATAYSNTVNVDAIFGAIPGALLMDSIVPDYDGQVWNVTYNIKEKPEGWNTLLLDTGYYHRLPDGTYRPILDDVGVPISEPAKLNGMGQVLPNQSMPGVNVGPWHKYPAKIFSLLQLPDFFLINTIQSNDDES